MCRTRTISHSLKFGAGVGLVIMAACQQAPITGRDQFIIIPEDQANELGVDAYRTILRENEISRDPEINRTVRRVGERIVAVADDPGYDWQFTVFHDKTPNAFALPGGKVGVNTGLFEVAKTEPMLAAVMAHEVAHALARHSAERMSRQAVLEGGLTAAGLASETASQYGGLLAQAATLGVILPFSREQESEADEIGLIYMARAGYDPRAAVALWRNFMAYGKSRTPEFLSTHPLPESRIERLEELMPHAIKVYEASRGQS